ncbi:free fatty acid receptor 2-like [Pimephales promelas]|uniref:free fatty acid receptor 2-like n=1 Tax=Pimephales promelas TaxID=90988 RepID=UPI001955DE25|nr:free fatty acid receptor 2-like [Pimephales promelas]XP_039534491.1 free fatty acid receptor 2-like [Pimephales promelas]KAG1948678.1 free fatty acid receptor [Pimephales promelas]
MAKLIHHTLLIFYILTFLFGLPANILAFFTFCRKVYRKPTPIDILLLNLTISDLIFLAVLPFKMKEAIDNLHWSLPYYLCSISSFLFFSTIYTSTLFLTAISIERYLGVAFPIRYALGRRPRNAVIASCFLWLLGSLNLSIVYIVPYINSTDNSSNSMLQPNPHVRICYDNFTKEQLKILLPVRLELFLMLFCIPLLICCFCYINFIRILSKLPHLGRRRRLRAIGLAVGTLLVFTISFSPYNISHVVGFIHENSEGWRHLALISSTLNACLDPIIFYFSSAAVRSAIRACVNGLKEKLHIVTCRRCCPSGPSKAEANKETNPPIDLG